jgi:hypothetical protein
MVGEELLPCAGKNCERFMHATCSTTVCARNKVEPLPSPAVTCTKKCHITAVKEAAPSKPGKVKNWNSDGAGGPKDPKSSEYYLVRWLMQEKNYAMWRGDKHGKSKSDICRSLAEYLHDKGCQKRDWDDVRQKIRHLEDDVRRANDYATSETGAGMEFQSQGSFKKMLLDISPYWEELSPVWRKFSGFNAVRPIAPARPPLEEGNGEPTERDDEDSDGDDVDSVRDEGEDSVDAAGREAAGREAALREEAIRGGELFDDDSSGSSDDEISQVKRKATVVAADGDDDDDDDDDSVVSEARTKLPAEPRGSGSSSSGSQPRRAASRPSSASSALSNARGASRASGKSSSLSHRTPRRPALASTVPISVRETKQQNKKNKKSRQDDDVMHDHFTWLEDAENRKNAMLLETKRNNEAIDAREREKNRLWEALEREKMQADARAGEYARKSQELHYRLELHKEYVAFKKANSNEMTAAEALKAVPMFKDLIKEDDFKPEDV